MSATTLFVSRCDRLSLADAVEAFSLIASEAVALLYSPDSCRFASLSSGALCGSDGGAVEFSSVFEARIFCPKAELRWVNDPGAEGRHRAVVLAEESLATSLGEAWNEAAIPVIDTLPQTYLLWGEGTGNAMPPSWSQLGAARIGALPVPVPGLSKKQRVLLTTREYFEAETEHGNVLVREERLCSLTRA
jgi:CRISPR-associated protein (TIGR03984 family)